MNHKKRYKNTHSAVDNLVRSMKSIVHKYETVLSDIDVLVDVS